MKSKEIKDYSLYTGCLIPSKYPFIEKASRMVLDKLNITLDNIEGASCCPNQMAIQSSDKDLWYLIAARNLALAEKNECDILSLCNGCYDTLKSVNSRLKSDEKFRTRINSMLAKIGLEYHGILDVKHLLQVLHDDIGTNAIENAITNPLKKLKFAPFVGCHVKRPMDHMGFDDPEKPYYLIDLIKITGAGVVSYSEEHSCCGGGLSIGREHDVVPFARRILSSARDAGGRGVVVNCPYCFAQFYRNEKAIMDIHSEEMELPVLYITQLIGLAFGFEPEELGMTYHYEKSVGKEEELVEDILAEEVVSGVFNDEITAEQLEICKSCQACIDDCQTAMTTSEYRPDEILEMVHEGKVDDAIRRKDIWFCMNCHECIQKCPQNFGMVKLIVRLKNLATVAGIRPAAVEHRFSELQKSGYSFAPDNECREALGLCVCTPPSPAELQKLMKEATVDKASD